MTRTTGIIAHRGASLERKENTLPAFLLALELGADAIELDVHATRDGVVVVHHDAVPRGQGTPPGRTMETLSHAAVAAVELHGGGRIPTLEEVLAAVDGRATAYVEIKGAGIEDAVARVIERSPTPCAVHSFDHRAIVRMATLMPDVPRGLLTTAYLLDPERALSAASARDWWQQWELVDEELVRKVHEAGGRVIAWTVDSPQAARRLAGWGVDAICTNAVSAIRDELRGIRA